VNLTSLQEGRWQAELLRRDTAKIRGVVLDDVDPRIPGAEDLAQQVLISVAGGIQRWETDPRRARFRTWLRRVADNAILNALTDETVCASNLPQSFVILRSCYAIIRLRTN